MRAALAGLLLLAGCAVGQPGPETPQPVAAVDLTRYLGTWHEVARLPMWAQDRAGVSCIRTTATYTAREDGRIGVLNRCINAVDGAERVATGQAYAVAGSGNARLRVSFFWPFFGDYWVLGLDPGYRWVVVGEPRRRYLWILSRTPLLPAEDVAKAEAIARAAGYDLAPLQRASQ